MTKPNFVEIISPENKIIINKNFIESLVETNNGATLTFISGRTMNLSEEKAYEKLRGLITNETY